MTLEYILYCIKRYFIILVTLILMPSCSYKYAGQESPQILSRKKISVGELMYAQKNQESLDNIEISLYLKKCEKFIEKVQKKKKYVYDWDNKDYELIFNSGAGVLGIGGLLTGCLFLGSEEEETAAAVGNIIMGAAVCGTWLLVNALKSGKTKFKTTEEERKDTVCEQEELRNKSVIVKIRGTQFKEEFTTNYSGIISISTKKLFPYASKSNSNITLNISYQGEETQIAISLGDILRGYIRGRIVEKIMKHKESFTISIMDVNTHYSLMSPEPNLTILSVEPSSDAAAKKIAWDVAKEVSGKYEFDFALAKSIAYDVATTEVGSHVKTESEFPIKKERVSQAEYTFFVIRYPRSTNINVSFSVMHPEYHFLEKTVRWSPEMSGINVFMSEVGSKIRIEEVEGYTGGVESK